MQSQHHQHWSAAAITELQLCCPSRRYGLAAVVGRPTRCFLAACSLPGVHHQLRTWQLQLSLRDCAPAILLQGTVVTEIEAIKDYSDAEAYHQQYLQVLLTGCTN